MTKRILDCSASDLAAFTKQELLASIAGSEGRVLAAECIGVTQPLLGGCNQCGVCGIHGSGYPSFEYVRCEGTRGKRAPAGGYLQGTRSVS